MTEAFRVLRELAPFLALGCFPVAAGAVVLFRRRVRSGWLRDRARRTTLLDGCLVASVMVILVVTLVAATPRLGHRPANFVPFRSIAQLVTSSVDGSIAIRNVLLNVLLFVPFGFFLALRLDRKRVLRSGLAGLCLALIIEAIQFVFLPGRVVDIDDVLLNVLGSIVGALAARPMSATSRLS